MDKVSGFWALLDALGNKPDEKRTRSTATYSGTDSDGTPWVTFPGSSEPTPVRGSVTSDLSMGDEVEVEVSNGRVSIVGNNTDPSLGTKAVARAIAPALEKAEQTERIAREATEGVVAAQTAVKAATDAATQAAANAQAAIEASDQHFFSDSNGVHVSTEEDAPTGTRNILINSLGVILRKASTILAQFTEGEVAFYDGDGNGAANVVAAFGTSGAQVGKGDAPHMNFKDTGIVGYNSENVPFFDIDYNGAETTADVVKDRRFSSESLSDDGVTTVASIDVSDLPSGTSTIPLDEARFDVTVPSASISASGISSSGFLYQYSQSTSPIAGYRVQAHVSSSFTVGTSATRSLQIPFDTYTLVLLAKYDAQAGTVSLAYEIDGTWDDQNACEFFCVVRASWNATTTSPAFTMGTRFGEPGSYSYVLGEGLYADGANQTALGKWNVEDTEDEYALIIGNGTDDNNRSNALAVDWDGNVSCSTVNGIAFDPVGTVLSETNTTDVSTSTNTDVASITLTAGTWLVNARLQFASNSTGRRAAKLSTTSADSSNVISTDARNAVDGGATNIQTERLFALSSQSTVYLIAWQNSGSTLSCTGDIQAVKLAVMNDVPFSTVYTSSSAPTSAQGSDGDVWLVV